MCVLRVKGIAAPQLQLTVAVQCFSAARLFSFSRENRNSDSYIKFRKQYVDQESATWLDVNHSLLVFNFV